MEYTLQGLEYAERDLLYSADKKKDGRTGCIGHLRADFDSGKLFYSNWFDHDFSLKSNVFKQEFDQVINYLRFDNSYPLLKSINDMRRLCREEYRVSSEEEKFGFKIVTLGYSYYLRCFPRKGDYNLYCYCYDNAKLFGYLKQISLPEICYAVLESSGKLVILKKGESGYYPTDSDCCDFEEAQNIADEKNTILGVTKAQASAMYAGSLFGWNIPAALPEFYDEEGHIKKELVGKA